MAKRRIDRIGSAIGVIFMMAFAGGCGTSLEESGTGSVLDLLSAADFSDDMPSTDMLNQLTVGDLVGGFVDFTDESAFGIGANHPSSPGLSDEQLTALESLQAQLGGGEITEAEFSDAVQELIGDRGAGLPFAGFSFCGSPFGHRMGNSAVSPLNLTDEQQAAAVEIFERLHDDIDGLRETTHEEVRALLTEEQLAVLDELGLPSDPNTNFSARHGRFGFGRPGGFTHGSFGSGSIISALELTEEQEMTLDTIRTELRESVQLRHEQARDEFLGLLTDEQLTELDGFTEEDE